MKNVSTLLILAALVLSGGAAPAEAQTKIAVLNVARVFEEYEMTRELESLFDQQRREAAEEADQRRANIDQMRRALTAFDPASDDFARRDADITRAEIEFQVWSNLAERRLKNNHKNWMLQIYRNTQGMVGEIAKERTIDLVLTYDRLTEDAPDSATLRQQILLQKVIFHSGNTDITDEVISRLNKRYKDGGGIQSISSTPPAAAAPASSPTGVDKPASDNR